MINCRSFGMHSPGGMVVTAEERSQNGNVVLITATSVFDFLQAQHCRN